jgi:hypothetical protein
LVFHIAAHGTRIDPKKIVWRVDAGTGPGSGTGACAGAALDVSASAEVDLAVMKLCNGLFVEETTYIVHATNNNTQSDDTHI